MDKSIYTSSETDQTITGNSEKPMICENQNMKEAEIGGGDAKRIMKGMVSAFIADAISGKREKPIVSGNRNKKEEGIGDDVKRIMEAIESAGLCGPKLPERVRSSAKEDANELSGAKSNKPRNQPNRETTSNATRNRPLSRLGTAASQVKGPTSTSSTKSRPSTASSASRKNQDSAANGVNGNSTLKNRKKTAPPASAARNGPFSTTPKPI